ncbi:MAG: universal stress protein [Acidobacteria bacterium]|nr:universal stress protein [Acidobacteriota bacterium]MCA1640792.1 universal stress protein [Acidobacteriota bacterium]
MFPFRNVLFPTDFSEHAHAALKYAAAFARGGAGRVVLFSVQEGSVPANLLTLPPRAFEEPQSEWLGNLRRDVEAVLADPLLAGLEVETRITEGDEPGREIADAARSLGIDLVTVSTHGRRGLRHALFGSTAEEIIAESSCPVLAVRPPQREFVSHRVGQTEIRLNRVLLATNFRPSSEPASRLAAEVAHAAGAEFHSIYVVGDYMGQLADLFPESGTRALSDLREYVRRRMEAFETVGGGKCVTHVAEGRPYEEIVRLATNEDVDLIVIGTSTHEAFFGGSPVLGAEIERVVRNAPCPVLCVPAGRVVTPDPVRVAATVPQM